LDKGFKCNHEHIICRFVKSSGILYPFSFPQKSVAYVRMKMDKPKLSNKIRVVSNPRKLENCPEKQLQFYTDYASAVSDTLRKPLFQKFLHWLMKREKIEKMAVNDIQVRVFPFKNENGRSLAGRCNSDGGVILIFPKRRSFLRKKLQNHKKEKIRFYLKSRAMAALIHELLHMKYEGNENKVRQLTEKYFGIFIRHQNPNAQNVHAIQKILFAF
jgi:hypothetical protein